MDKKWKIRLDDHLSLQFRILELRITNNCWSKSFNIVTITIVISSWTSHLAGWVRTNDIHGLQSFIKSDAFLTVSSRLVLSSFILYIQHMLLYIRILHTHCLYCIAPDPSRGCLRCIGTEIKAWAAVGPTSVRRRLIFEDIRKESNRGDYQASEECEWKEIRQL